LKKQTLKIICYAHSYTRRINRTTSLLTRKYRARTELSHTTARVALLPVVSAINSCSHFYNCYTLKVENVPEIILSRTVAFALYNLCIFNEIACKSRKAFNAIEYTSLRAHLFADPTVTDSLYRSICC
jgi:hypothetical protein